MKRRLFHFLFAAFSVQCFGEEPLPPALSHAQNDELHQFLDESANEKEIPGGSLLLLRNGQLIFESGFGFADIKNRAPFTSTAPCRIASLSKPVIATLLVMLAAEGSVDLDKSISFYLPEFKDAKLQGEPSLSRMPTVRECLKHTAGFLPDQKTGGRPWLKFSGQGLTLEQAVKKEAEEIPFIEEPAKVFGYSGIGYDVAGRIAEVCSGQSLNDLLQEKLCKPLGMKHTTFHPDAATLNEIPRFYWHWRSDDTFHAGKKRPPIKKGNYTAVGGGIVSNLADYSKFLQLHLNEGNYEGRQIIPRDAILQMRKRYRPGSYYGLGFSLGPAPRDDLADSVMHTGSSGTQFWIDFKSKSIGILFTQSRMSAGRSNGNDVIPSDQSSWQKQAKKEIQRIVISSPARN